VGRLSHLKGGREGRKIFHALRIEAQPGLGWAKGIEKGKEKGVRRREKGRGACLLWYKKEKKEGGRKLGTNGGRGGNRSLLCR